MIKIAGLSLLVVFSSLLIKDKSRTIAVVLSIAGGITLFLIVAGEFSDVINSVKVMSGGNAVTNAYIKLMLKALGITLLTQFVSDICRDNGENALASITETASKIAVIAMLLPLFETIIEMVSGLLK